MNSFISQASDSNPLVGFDNRVELLKRLGDELLYHPDFFLKDGVSRPGHLVDYLLTQVIIYAFQDCHCLTVEIVFFSLPLETDALRISVGPSYRMC